MASRSVDLILHILGDSSGAEKATKAASTSVGKMSKTVGKLTIPALAVAGAVAVIGEQSVEAASKAEEAFHGLDAVFGKNAKTVEEWAKKSETSAGLSHAAYAQLATSIGGQLHAMGLPMSQVLADTQALIDKGADLSAVYGGSTTDATMALAAAMRGASKASAKLGLSLKPATVNALLASRGQDKLKGSALNAAKAQATLDLIAQQSSGSVGKFAEEAGTAGESAKIASAKWEDAKAALGKSLLPAVEEGTTLLGGMADVLQRNASLTSGLVGTIGALALGVLLLNGALKTYNAIQAVSNGLQAWAASSSLAETIGLNAMYISAGLAALATWDLAAATAAFDAVDPFTWIVVAVVALVALVVAIVEAYKHSQRFRAIVTGAFDAVKVAAVAVARALTVAWSAVWGAIQTGASAVGRAWSAVSGAVGTVLDVVRRVANAVGSGLTTAFDAVRGVVEGVARAVSSALGGAFNTVRGIALAFATVVGRVLGPAFSVVLAAARLYFTVVQLGFTIVLAIVRLTAEAIMLAFEVAWAYIRLGATAVAALVSTVFRAMAGPVVAAISAVATAFRVAFAAVSALATTVAAFIAGVFRTVGAAISSAFRTAFAAVRAAVSAAASFVRAALQPLVGPARAVASAIASVFRSAFAGVSAAARAVVSAIRTALSTLKGAFDAVAGVARALGQKIQSGLSAAAGFIDGITSKVKTLIGWISKIKIPKIKLPGIGSVSASAPSAATRRAPALALTSAAPRVGARAAVVSGASTGSADGLTVNVFGLLDGADAARKIRQILRDDDRRRSGVRVVARTVTG